MPLNIRKVENDDLEQLVKLINVAYRTQSGRSWTTEQAFVAGDRINKTQLIDQLNQSNFELLIGETESTQLVACIGLSYQQDCAEIGTFAIDPSIQNFRYWQGNPCLCRAVCPAESSISYLFPDVCTGCAN